MGMSGKNEQRILMADLQRKFKSSWPWQCKSNRNSQRDKLKWRSSFILMRRQLFYAQKIHFEYKHLICYLYGSYYL